MKKVYNLTPHSIDICDEDKQEVASIEPEGLVVRAQIEERVWRTLGSHDTPVWAIGVTEPTMETNPLHEGAIPKRIGKDNEEIFIIVSKLAADAIMNLSYKGFLWDWVSDKVKKIHVMTVHKSQFNEDRSKRYGALGFAIQGTIWRNE